MEMPSRGSEVLLEDLLLGDPATKIVIIMMVAVAVAAAAVVVVKVAEVARADLLLGPVSVAIGTTTTSKEEITITVASITMGMEVALLLPERHLGTKLLLPGHSLTEGSLAAATLASLPWVPPLALEDLRQLASEHPRRPALTT